MFPISASILAPTPSLASSDWSLILGEGHGVLCAVLWDSVSEGSTVLITIAPISEGATRLPHPDPTHEQLTMVRGGV